MFEDGGLKDQGGTVDPVSGNSVPSGSLKSEVRDDVPAQVSEGEFIFPADVVRYIGLEKLMVMRQKAKEGLSRMEDMGQMGNSDEATLPDDLPFDESDLIATDEDGNEIKMKSGGDVPSNAYNEYMKSAGIQQKTFVNPDTGDTIKVYMVNGTAIPAIPPGYFPEGAVSQDTLQESKVTNAVPSDVPKPEREDTDSFYEGKSVRQGRSIDITGAEWANADESVAEGEEGSSMFKLDRNLLSGAPAGWTSQNQREYDTMKTKTSNIKAMWNGNDWDVYSPEMDGTAYGTPGTRGLQSKYPDQLKIMGNALKSGATSALTGFKGIEKVPSEVNKSYVTGFGKAYEEKAKQYGIQSKDGVPLPSRPKKRDRVTSNIQNLKTSKEIISTTNKDEKKEEPVYSLDNRSKKEKDKAEDAYDKAMKEPSAIGVGGIKKPMVFKETKGSTRYKDIGSQSFMKRGGLASKK